MPFGTSFVAGAQLREAIDRRKAANDLERKRLKLIEDQMEFRRQGLTRALQGQQALGDVFGLSGSGQQQRLPNLPQSQQTTPFDPTQARQHAQRQAVSEALRAGVPLQEALIAAQGLPTQAAEEFTLRPGEVRFRGREPIAAVPEVATSSEPLINAIMAEPRLLNAIPGTQRASILPELVKRGMRAADIENPLSRQIRRLQHQQLMTQIAAAERTRQGVLTPGALNEARRNIRRDIRAEPAFRDLVAMRSGLRSVETGAQRGDAQGDLAIVNGIARLLDPGSVVRPGEFTTVQEAQGFMDRMLNIGQQIAAGDRLRDEIRQRFLQLAQQLFERGEEEARLEIEQVYDPIVNELGIPLEEVTGFQPRGVVEVGSTVIPAD